MANKKRIATSVAAVATAAALLLGGTFAWQSVNQTALNEASDVINPGGRLHDDFNGSNKDVYVENFTDPANGGEDISLIAKIEKAFEKEDLERQSFIKISLKFNPFAFMLKGFGRRFLGMDEVGSFEIDTVFTRKKLLGVCNMIAWANNWSVETVRAFTVLLFFVSLFFYVILAISMKLGFYLFNLHVEKRS